MKERLEQLLNDRNMRPSRLAQAAGLSTSTVDDIIKGKTNALNIGVDKILKIANALEVSVEYLYGREGSEKARIHAISHNEMMLIRKIRALDQHGITAVSALLDCEYERCMEISAIRGKVIPLRLSEQKASAGTGIYLGPEAFTTIYVRENDLTQRATFSVQVSGDSMEPDFHDGDLLLIEGAPCIKVGDIGLFTMDGEGYIKKRGNKELISLNPEYNPIPMNESIRCNGRVIGVLDPAWISESFQ